MQDKIDSDIKAAMLAGDKAKAETLRGLKSAILNEAIAQGVKDKGLDDVQTQKVLLKEVKKRQEAADLYRQGGNSERATAEMEEKQIIEAYLPEQASEADIEAAVKQIISSTGASSQAEMGIVISAVKTQFGGAADGATIARITKEQLGV